MSRNAFCTVSSYAASLLAPRHRLRGRRLETAAAGGVDRPGDLAREGPGPRQAGGRPPSAALAKPSTPVSERRKYRGRAPRRSSSSPRRGSARPPGEMVLGRRVSSSDGSPPGTSGASTVLERGRRALDRAGVVAEQHRQGVFLQRDLAPQLGQRGERILVPRRGSASIAKSEITPPRSLTPEQVEHIACASATVSLGLISEPRVEVELVEVRRPTGRDQRQALPAPRFLGHRRPARAASVSRRDAALLVERSPGLAVSTPPTLERVSPTRTVRCPARWCVGGWPRLRSRPAAALRARAADDRLRASSTPARWRSSRSPRKPAPGDERAASSVRSPNDWPLHAFVGCERGGRVLKRNWSGTATPGRS